MFLLVHKPSVMYGATFDISMWTDEQRSRALRDIPCAMLYTPKGTNGTYIAFDHYISEVEAVEYLRKIVFG